VVRKLPEPSDSKNTVMSPVAFGTKKHCSGASQRSVSHLLSQLGVAVVRSEKLVTEARDSSEAQRSRPTAVQSHYKATASED
jgi:hypothetical protein